MREFQTLLDFSGSWQQVMWLWAEAGPDWTTIQNTAASGEGEVFIKIQPLHFRNYITVWFVDSDGCSRKDYRICKDL